jgi:hypothetical protein
MTAHEFAANINEWARETMIANHGTRFVTAGQDRAVAQLDAEARRVDHGRTTIVEVDDDRRRLVATRPSPRPNRG